MKMITCDNNVEANYFGVNRVLEKALRVVLFLRRPIP